MAPASSTTTIVQRNNPSLGLQIGLAVLLMLALLTPVAGVWSALPARGAVGDLIRVSGDNANEDALNPSVSGSGRYVAFESRASDLIPDDDNFNHDVFLHDSQTGDTTLISQGINGGSGDDHSTDPSISADGRYIVFVSEATDLVPNDSNGVADIFLYDTSTTAMSVVSLTDNGNASNGISIYPTISEDGRYVAFASTGSNLVAGDTNGVYDIFIRDRLSGSTRLITKDASGAPLVSPTFHAVVSADGLWVAYGTQAHGIVPGDGNNLDDVYLYEIATGDVTHVSQADVGGTSNGDSVGPVVSADGRYVAYSTDASDIVADDNNNASDVIRHDRITGDSTIVSLNGVGDSATGFSDGAAISANGRYVAFSSDAPDLSSGDINGEYDVFVRDVVAGTTTLASPDTNGGPANGESYEPALSSDGRYLAYQSRATDLIARDTNGWMDVFRYQFLPGPTPPPPPTTVTSSTLTTSTTTTAVTTSTTTAPGSITTTTTIPEQPDKSPKDHFGDDDGHLFEDDINAIADAEITRGCNPPQNDNYCPDDSFLRGQAAAFLRRALDVPATSINHFTDDDGVIFEGDINAIADAGITLGCNPPDNNLFCPDDPFTRGQAAAFVRRALDVPSSSADYFTDDDGEVFEADINAIAAAGITRGCNPPDNNQYCPNDLLTRGQAAAYIRRALLR